MKKYLKMIATVLAIIGPPLLGTLSVELSYVFSCNGQWWPIVTFYAFPQIIALIFLFRTISWPWWVKCLAAVPFLALSLIATIYACLIVAAANGDGL
jgi:hypothetical protein